MLQKASDKPKLEKLFDLKAKIDRKLLVESHESGKILKEALESNSKTFAPQNSLEQGKSPLRLSTNPNTTPPPTPNNKSKAHKKKAKK